MGRHFSWNPFEYVKSGYYSVKSYWSSTPEKGTQQGQSGGQDQGSSNNSSLTPQPTLVYTPVVVDLREAENEDKEIYLEKKPAENPQSMFKVVFLMALRFRRQLLKVFGKLLQTMLHDYQEYLFLGLLFLLL